MPTIKEVASRAGVSPTTASLVLNPFSKQRDRISPECAERVRAAAEELGYVPNYHARSMKSGRAEAIGMVLETPQRSDEAARGGQTGNEYFHGLISGLETATHGAGYVLSLIGPQEDRRALARGIEAIQQRRLDGLVVPGLVSVTRGDSEANRQLLAAHDLPIVVVQPPLAIHMPSVDFDQEAGVRLIVEHLAELGHRQLLWLGPDWGEGPTSPTERERCLMAAVWDSDMRGASCRFPVSLCGAELPDEKLLGTSAAALGERLAAGGEQTAVVCYNDTVALGALRALHRAGLRVPEDVSVVGFDDTLAFAGSVSLTTVDHRFWEMGRRAGEMVLEILADDGAMKAMQGRRDMVQPRLVVRESTGPAARPN